VKKIILAIWILFLLSTFTVFWEDDWYYKESIDAFINSPSLEDLDKIQDENTRYCEQVYLEATRRRDYTKEELNKCSKIFEIKKQQEIDYINYSLSNRGIFN